MEEAEKQLIIKTLEATNNNKTRAAEILGISLKTLHNKLKEYGSAAAERGCRRKMGPLAASRRVAILLNLARASPGGMSWNSSTNRPGLLSCKFLVLISQ